MSFSDSSDGNNFFRSSSSSSSSRSQITVADASLEIPMGSSLDKKSLRRLGRSISQEESTKNIEIMSDLSNTQQAILAIRDLPPIQSIRCASPIFMLLLSRIRVLVFKEGVILASGRILAASARFMQTREKGRLPSAFGIGLIHNSQLQTEAAPCHTYSVKEDL